MALELEIAVILSPAQVRHLIQATRDHQLPERGAIRTALVEAYTDHILAEIGEAKGRNLAAQETTTPPPTTPKPEPTYYAPGVAKALVKDWLRKEAWSPAYKSGGKKGGATKVEIVSGTGLTPGLVKEALEGLGEELKTGGEKAGRWYRLK
jgi:hypothetical protein